MPLRPYELDPGFDTPDYSITNPPEPERPGGGLFQFGENWQNIVRDAQEAPAVLGAAFELENDLVNAWQLMTKPVFESDPNFDLEANLKASGLWEDYRWNFVGVASPGEFLYKARKIRREEDARRTLAAAGPDGVMASMIAGFISPTTLLPFVGPGVKGAKAVGLGLAWGALGGGLQEVPLQLNQELRTLSESATSVGFSTIVGGVLGGGIGFLNRGLDDLAGDMAPTGGVKTISPSEQRVLVQRRMAEIDELAPKAQNDNELSDFVTERMQLEGRLRELDDADRRMMLAKETDDAIAGSALGKKAAAGADVLDTDAGGLKNMLGVGERLTKLAGPVTGVLGQKVSKVGRQMMAELSTAGLRLEGNSILDREGNVIGGLPSNRGGTVESIINSRRGDTLQFIDEAYETYGDYWFGKDQGHGPFRNSRAAAAGTLKGKSVGKLNRRQFFEEVGKAMWQGDQHPIPEVQKVAQNFRKYYNQLLKEAQDAGLISREIEQVAPDLSFLNRVYDTVAISRNPNRFQQLLADHFNAKLTEDLQKLHEAYVKGEARDNERLFFMDMPLEQAQKLRQQYLDELKALNEADDDDLTAIEDLISKNRSALADNTRARRKAEKALDVGSTSERRAARAEVERLEAERADIRERIAELKAAGGEDLEARRLHKAQLKSRIRALNRSRFMVEEKARTKYDKIDALEEDSIEALDRLMHQGHRALKRSEAEGDAFEADLNNMRSALRNAQSKTAGYEQQVQALEDAAAAERTNRQGIDVTTLVEGDYTPDERAMVIQDARDFYIAARDGQIPEGTEASQLPILPEENAWVELAAREESIRAAVSAASKQKAQSVNIADLVTQQPYVAPERVAGAGKSRESIIVIKMGDQLILRNGNHRVEAALRRGDTAINAKVIEVQPSGVDWLTKIDSTATEPEALILNRLFKKEEQLQKSTDRFNELADDLDAFENYNFAEGGRREAEQLIRDTMTAAAERINRLNTARAKRIAKLEAQIEKMDVAGWQARRQEIVDRIKARREKTIERIRNLGGENYDPVKGTADFTDRAKEIAQLATERIQGTNMRLAGFDAMADARGTELARTLSIPSMTLAREGFLVSDAEHLLHVYANTLIPDIEITNRLGPFAPDGQRNFNFQALNEEMRQLQARREAIAREEAERTGKPLDEVKLGNELQGIEREYKSIRSNLDAVIRRLRHQWGLPEDPHALSARAATTVLALQAWRFLGGVVISSLPDLAKPIIRYGLLRTLRHGWLPMIANWKAMKMTAADARRAFVAIESATADRSFQLTELMHYARRKTKFESGLEWATSKLGIVFGFAPWTDLMKTVSAMSFNSKLMDSIDLSLNSAKTSKARLDAIDFLNSLGLSESDQRRIWAEMQNGGAQQINGTWVPETANWTDRSAIRAYRAALNNESSSSIITPGVELPKWANSSPMARILVNLKSFALASTSKTLMAALQQRDMAVLNGVVISLALGALSFYLRSVIAGGATEERMRNATPEQWVDEALDASGLLGVLSVVQQIGDNIPGVRNVARPGALAQTLQGKDPSGTARSQASGLIEDVFGPSADLAFTTAAILTRLDKVDRGQIHRIRQLLPMQNLILVRRLFDQLENTTGDLLNASGQRR